MSVCEANMADALPRCCRGSDGSCGCSQVRNVSFDEGAAARMRDGPPPAVQRGKGALSAELQSMVERSDTIFLATYYDSPDAPPG
jgi:hypothetical protein